VSVVIIIIIIIIGENITKYRGYIGTAVYRAITIRYFFIHSRRNKPTGGSILELTAGLARRQNVNKNWQRKLDGMKLQQTGRHFDLLLTTDQ